MIIATPGFTANFHSTGEPHFGQKPDPREKPFDDPTPRVNSKADLIEVLAHDLDRNQRSLGDLLTGISAVGEDPLDEREGAP